MSRLAKRIGAGLTALFAVLGIVTGVAGVASAATAGVTPVNTFYTGGPNAFLAGQIEASTVRLDANRITWTNLPNLSGYTGGEDTVGIGGVLAATTNGGWGIGIAMVWDDTSQGGTCGAGFYTLEGGQGLITLNHGLAVLPFSDLHPLDQFGGPACFSAGASQWGAVKESIKGKNVYFESGGSEALATVDSLQFGCDTQFFAAGEGVMVDNGIDAAKLPTGTLAFFGNLGLNRREPTKDVRITDDSLPTYVVDATQNGGVPSISNPLVLKTSGFGGSSSFSVTVPPGI